MSIVRIKRVYLKIQEGVETVYRVKRLPWRCEVAGCMDIIDGQQHKDSDILATQGAKPIKRVRGSAPIATFIL
jgi:hypothetical protein